MNGDKVITTWSPEKTGSCIALKFEPIRSAKIMCCPRRVTVCPNAVTTSPTVTSLGILEPTGTSVRHFRSRNNKYHLVLANFRTLYWAIYWTYVFNSFFKLYRKERRTFFSMVTSRCDAVTNILRDRRRYKYGAHSVDRSAQRTDARFFCVRLF